MSELANNTVCLVVKDIQSARLSGDVEVQPLQSFEKLVQDFGIILTKTSETLQAIFNGDPEDKKERLEYMFNRFASHTPLVAAVPREKFEAFKEGCEKSGGMVLTIAA